MNDITIGLLFLCSGLVPVLFPLVGGVLGTVRDRIAPPRPSPATRAVQRAKERAAARRVEWSPGQGGPDEASPAQDHRLAA